MPRHTEEHPTDDTPDCVIRYATTDDVPALRRLVQQANVRLFCGPALVADIAGVLGAAVSLADGQVIADPSQPASVLRRLLRTRRDTSLTPS